LVCYFALFATELLLNLLPLSTQIKKFLLRYKIISIVATKHAINDCIFSSFLYNATADLFSAPILSSYWVACSLFCLTTF